MKVRNKAITISSKTGKLLTSKSNTLKLINYLDKVKIK